MTEKRLDHDRKMITPTNMTDWTWPEWKSFSWVLKRNKFIFFRINFSFRILNMTEIRSSSNVHVRRCDLFGRVHIFRSYSFGHVDSVKWLFLKKITIKIIFYIYSLTHKLNLKFLQVLYFTWACANFLSTNCMTCQISDCLPFSTLKDKQLKLFLRSDSLLHTTTFFSWIQEHIQLTENHILSFLSSQ